MQVVLLRENLLLHCSRLQLLQAFNSLLIGFANFPFLQKLGGEEEGEGEGEGEDPSLVGYLEA